MFLMSEGIVREYFALLEIGALRRQFDEAVDILEIGEIARATARIGISHEFSVFIACVDLKKISELRSKRKILCKNSLPRYRVNAQAFRKP